MFFKLLSFLTKHPRYRPEIQWSGKSWTHNVFRFYEMLFGRRFGIRKEMSASAYKDKAGKTHVTYMAHSFEAVCALAEQYVRTWLTEKKLARIYFPKLAPASPDFSLSGPFLFAIAFDNSAKSSATATTSLTYAHTCTGSNLTMFVNAGDDFSGTTFSDTTYNAVSMSTVQSEIASSPAGIRYRMMYLASPATGSNNVVITFTGSNGSVVGQSASYSGTKQTGQPSASALDGFGAHTGSYSQALTTVDDNSWVVWAFFVQTPVSNGTGTVVRQQDSTIHGNGIADGNGAVSPAGSSTLTVTYAGNNGTAGIIAAISPASPVASNSNLGLLRTG